LTYRLTNVEIEQVKSLDIAARNAEFKEKSPTDIIGAVVAIVLGFVEITS